MNENPADTSEQAEQTQTDAGTPLEQARPITMARRVIGADLGLGSDAPAIPYARLEQRSPIQLQLNGWKALLQILALVPFMVIGMIAGAVTAIFTGHADDAWFNVFASTGMGLGGLAYVIMYMQLANAPAASIGWTAREWFVNAGIGIASLFLFYVIAFVIAMMIMIAIAQHDPSILSAEPESARAIKETFPRMSLPALFIMMTFVAIWEEIVFRGFLLTRLYAMVNRWWLAVFLGAVIFSFGHIYQGLLGMFLPFVPGLVLGGLFVWRRSLVPCIVYHICQNVFAVQMTQWIYSGS